MKSTCDTHKDNSVLNTFVRLDILVNTIISTCGRKSKRTLINQCSISDGYLLKSRPLLLLSKYLVSTRSRTKVQQRWLRCLFTWKLRRKNNKNQYARKSSTACLCSALQVGSKNGSRQDNSSNCCPDVSKTYSVSALSSRAASSRQKDFQMEKMTELATALTGLALALFLLFNT